ncbi:MAG: alpha/beta hydrolase fold protein [Proteobacteria bacterium]|nr:alpha/beta hydrolase fold protein [Pseudomonadota bacterium]
MESLHSFEYPLGEERVHITYRLWSQPGSEKRPTVICAHGIAQNSRHFDALANRLCRDFDVITPDYPGRGRSNWLQNKLNYTHQSYAAIFGAFMQQLPADEIYWIGTSMAGITGIMLASQANTPIHKLVLNDIGPVVPLVSMQAALISAQRPPMVFVSFEEALERVGPYTANFGITDPALKETFVRASVRQMDDGTWRPDYDPDIYCRVRQNPELAAQSYPYWNFWETIRCPVLVVHGADSTTLTAETIAQMRQTRPDLTVVDIPNTGHAPHLMDDTQAEIIRQWLLKP